MAQMALVKSVNTNSNLYHIAEHIETQTRASRNPIIVYIGVGTYMCRFQKDADGNDFIPLEDSQQFPPALQSLYQSHPDLEFYIILIDPILENPPYITRDPNVKNILNNPIFTKSMFNSEVELFTNPRLNIFVIRDNVGIREIGYHSYDGVCDIKDNLTYFHDMCIRNNILYIYHDFSGANLRILSRYFNDSIKDNLDVIIYGFGNGYVDDCIVNLLDEKCQLATIRKATENRDIICCYNIDKIMINNLNIHEYINDFNEFNIENVHIITEINKLLIDKIYSEFTNYILQILRNVKEIDTKIYNNTFEFDNSNLININHYISLTTDDYLEINELIINKDNLLFEKVKQIIANRYEIVFKFITTGGLFENYNSKQIIDYITLDDIPYKWYNNLKNILSK